MCEFFFFFSIVVLNPYFLFLEKEKKKKNQTQTLKQKIFVLYFDIITAQDENVWELRGELDLFCVGFGLFLWLLGLISETKPSKVMPEETGQDDLLSEPPFFGCSNASNRYFCLQQPLELVYSPLHGGFAISDPVAVFCQFVLC